MARVYYPQARAILQVVFDGFGDAASDTEPVIIDVIPKSVSVQRNGYQQPDAWELTFEGSDLPVDPQQIRAGSVEIFLYSTDGVAKGSTILSRQFTNVDDPAALTGRTPSDATAVELGMADHKKFAMGAKPTIAGQFDDVSCEFTTSGRWVTISGQDYTLFLKGRQWPPKSTSVFRGKVNAKTGKQAGGKKNGKLVGVARRIPTGKRLDQILEDILAEADPSGRLKLTPKNLDVTTLPTVGDGETRGNQRGIPVKEQTSYWDVMYKLATRYGCILYVSGLDVVLAKPKNITSNAVTDLRKLHWGHNVDSLRISRSLGKEKVPRIVVRGYDQKQRKTVTETYPENDQEIPAGTLGVNQDEYQIIPVYGITDRRVLRQMAENLFHIIGRGEHKMVVSTRDLRDQNDKSILDLEPGDAVDVDFVDFNREVLANPKVSEQAKAQHLVDRGYNPTVAQVIAGNYSRLFGNKRPMRVREASFSYDTDSGIQIELELTDFIVINGVRTADNQVSRADARAEKMVTTQGEPVTNDILTAQKGVF